MERTEGNLAFSLKLIKDRRILWLTRRLLSETKANNPAIADGLGERFIYRDEMPIDSGLEEIRIEPRADAWGVGMVWSRVPRINPHSETRFGKSLWLNSIGDVRVSLDRYDGIELDPEANPATNFRHLADERSYSDYNAPMRVVANYLHDVDHLVSEIVPVVDSHV